MLLFPALCLSNFSDLSAFTSLEAALTRGTFESCRLPGQGSGLPWKLPAQGQGALCGTVPKPLADGALVIEGPANVQCETWERDAELSCNSHRERLERDSLLVGRHNAHERRGDIAPRVHPGAPL